MGTQKTIIVLGLGAVALYLLWRTSRASGTELGNALSLLDPFFGGVSSVPTVPTVQSGNVSSMPSNPMSIATPAIGTAAAGIGAAGVTGAAAVATLGIAAGAAILAYGISQEGWFRGGEEALHVNPARDEYLAGFAQLDPYRDANNPPGFYGLAWLLHELNPLNDALFTAMLRADTMDEYTPAVDRIRQTLAANRDRTLTLINYAIANHPIAA